jgi:hypothetical protein
MTSQKRRKLPKWKQRLYRKRQRIYFWLKRQFELRNIQFSTFSSDIINNLIDRAISTGKEEMEKYLNDLLKPVPFYMNFKARKVLREQTDAIKLLKRIKLA